MGEGNYITVEQISEATGMSLSSVNRRLLHLKKSDPPGYKRIVQKTPVNNRKLYREALVMEYFANFKKEVKKDREETTKVFSTETTQLDNQTVDVQQRISAVYDLLLQGARRKDILTTFTKNGINVSSRQIDDYIAEAKAIIRQQAIVDREYEYAKHIEQLDYLYALSLQSKDYRTALAIKRDIYEAKKLHHFDIVGASSGDDFSKYTDEELDAIIAHEKKMNRNAG